MQLIGILGGAFDPIHFGHLRLAQEMGEALGLAEVRFIPTAYPPHRPPSATIADHRLAMVRLAIEGNPLFCCDDREIARYNAQQKPSYTLDTLLSLERDAAAGSALCLLLGADAFLGLPSWYRWQELLQHCHIIVAHRPNSNLQPEYFPQPLKSVWEDAATSDVDAIKEKKHGHILLQQITALDISATRIRHDLDQSKNPRYLLPDAVLAYILTHNLYR